MSNAQLLKQVQAGFMKKDLPELKTGMEVEVHQVIKEGSKSRVQKFKGLIIKVAGKSEMEKTITVRRKVGAFGVERIFAIHSTTIEKIEVIRKFKVRRKSIKFIRDLTGKAARLKEIRTPASELNSPREIVVPEVVAKEAPKATEKPEAKTDTAAEGATKEETTPETKTEEK